MNITLKDQVALVTGASRGIGKAVAERLGRAGAYVAGTATTENGAAGIEEYFRDAGINGKGYVLDIRADESVADLNEALKSADSRPSILVNNAGITRDNLMMRMKQQEWDEVIDTNLNSVYRLCKLCLRDMVKARHGRIINITSVVALSGNPGQTNYVAAKSGMIGFTRALAKEIGSRGITVNCISPGVHNTPRRAHDSPEEQQLIMDNIPMKSLGEPADLAETVVFLCLPGSRYITGVILPQDGGHSI